MLLSAISADLGYSIFTNANEKFISAFVTVFTKTDATLPPQLYKSSYRKGKKGKGKGCQFV